MGIGVYHPGHHDILCDQSGVRIAIESVSSGQRLCMLGLWIQHCKKGHGSMVGLWAQSHRLTQALEIPFEVRVVEL